MRNLLDEGTELSMVIGPPDADGDSTVWMVDGNHPLQFNCKSIVVVLEVGNMSWLPWARCEHQDGTVDLVNLTNAVSVELAERAKRQESHDE